MKKHTVMLTAFLVAVVGFAQKPFVKGEMFAKITDDAVQAIEFVDAQQPGNLMPSTRAHTLKKAATAADFVGEYIWKYKLCQSYSTDLTSLETASRSAKVSITLSQKTSGGLTISGMFHNDLEATVKKYGTGDCFIISKGQAGGTSEYGDYNIYGMEYDSDNARWTTKDIYCYLNDDGSIYISDWIIRILTGGEYDGYNLKPYYVIGSTLTPGSSQVAVTPPAGLVTEEYTVSARNKKDDEDVSGTVQIGFNGNDVYIQGLCAWLPDAWVKGILSGSTITFSTGQYLGTYTNNNNVSYDMYLNVELGKDVVFNYNSSDGTFTLQNEFFVIDNDEYYFDSYRNCVLKKSPVTPTTVTPPAGVTAKDYVMSYDDGSVPIKVVVSGNDVYFQGMSYYLPEAWVKGTKSGNQVTFASMQYMGDYYSYGPSYFFYNGEAVFTYNANADTYSASGQVYGYIADIYYDGNYTNPVLKRAVERAVMPANPKITYLEESEKYGWYFYFNVPLLDVNDNALVASKLSYMIYTDTEGTISPLTFTPATHERLTENITEIPYGFTEYWDFYVRQIYLNGLYSEDWNNIGIKSIYRGGGKVNETEIQWFHIKDYTVVEDGIVFDFNKMDLPVSSNLNTSGKILEEKTFTQDIVSLSISPKVSGTDNSFWSATEGPQLRMYSGTLTFSVPLGKGITGIKFNHSGYWGANTIDGTTIPNDATNKVATWTLAEGVNPYQEVVVKIGGSSRINSIVVTVDDAEVKTVEVPADLVCETYHFSGYDSYEKTDVTRDIAVGFYGESNVYIQGLSSYIPSAWVKGALKGTMLTIPETYLGICSNKFGDFDLYFSGATFVYDAEAGTFTSEEGYVSYKTPDDQNMIDEFTNVVLTKLIADAIPAAPTITSIKDTGYRPNVCFIIPTKDVDGHQLYTKNLAYQIWIEKNGAPRPLVLSANLYEALNEDMSEIPYTFTDNRDIFNNMIYLNQDVNEIATWKKIGIQSIYYGEKKSNKSNVIWSETPTDISHIFGDEEGTVNDKQDSTIFNLAGQRVQKAQKGLYIMKQGSTKANVKKVLR